MLPLTVFQGDQGFPGDRGGAGETGDPGADVSTDSDINIVVLNNLLKVVHPKLIPVSSSSPRQLLEKLDKL